MTRLLVSILAFALSCTRTANTTQSAAGGAVGSTPKPTLMAEPGFTKLAISRQDSTLWLRADITRDYHIFGYDQPDTTAKKLLLLSVFTDSVEGNPHKCLYGAYYESASLNGLQLTFVGFTKAFAESRLLSGAKPVDTLYFRKEWVMWAP